MKPLIALLLLAGIAVPAAAEVRSSSPSGFEIEHRAETRLPPDRLYRLLIDVANWWNGSHTYSGKASNLSLDPRPGGCWCEAMPGGGVEHMRVVQVQRGRSLVLVGSLGPLVDEATSGVMRWTIAPSSTGSTIVLNYRVGGFYKGDGARLAGPVDQVLGEQVRRLHKTAEDLAVRR